MAASNIQNLSILFTGDGGRVGETEQAAFRPSVSNFNNSKIFCFSDGPMRDWLLFGRDSPVIGICYGWNCYILAFEHDNVFIGIRCLPNSQFLAHLELAVNPLKSKSFLTSISRSVEYQLEVWTISRSKFVCQLWNCMLIR